MNPAQAMQIALLLPLAGAALAWILRRRPRLLAVSGPLVAAATTAVLATQLRGVRSGARPSFNLIQVFPEVWLGLRLEPLGLLFALIAASLWIPASAHAGAWLHSSGDRHAARFLGCTALAVALALGVALARNLLSLFVFLELLCLACYPLVAHADDERARRAGRTFLGMLLGASGSLLFLALAWTFHLCGTLELRPEGILAGRAAGLEASALLALFAFGIAPAALMPCHRWLLAAMAAPAPARAFPIAALLAHAGAFALLRVAEQVFGAELLAEVGAARGLRWAAAITILWAAVQALRARDLWIRLAYATTSQLGSLALGAFLAAGSGVSGAGLHLAAHAAGALALFLCAGNVELATGRTEIGALAGSGRTPAVTWIAFALGALALTGLPPIGAWSEWHRALGAHPPGPAWAGVLALGSLASAAALLAIPARVLSAKAAAPVRSIPFACVLAACAAALACGTLYALAEQIAAFLA